MIEIEGIWVRGRQIGRCQVRFAKIQKNQLKYVFTAEDTGEAPSVAKEGTESLAGKRRIRVRTYGGVTRKAGDRLNFPICYRLSA
jgi:hypothetical protein